MHIKKLYFIFPVLMLFAVSNMEAKEAGLSGRDIMVKVDARPKGYDRRSNMKMILINKRGRVKERKVMSFSKDYGKDSKSLIYFLKPADVEGVSFLSWEYSKVQKEDDKWLYLPALRKVKRISGSSKYDYFMGTDFTYDDLGERQVDIDKHKLLREELFFMQNVWVVESVPKNEKDIYSKRISWIRKDVLMAIRVEYYDRAGKLMKVLIVSDIKKKDGYWTIYKMEMDNLKEKHRTKLIMDNVVYDSKLGNNLFSVSNLGRRISK